MNETYDMLDEYSLIYNTDKKVFLTEVDSKFNMVMRYYNIDAIPFNFDFFDILNNQSQALDFKNNIEN